MADREQLLMALDIRKNNYDALCTDRADIEREIQSVTSKRDHIHSSQLVLESEMHELELQLLDIDDREAVCWDVFVNYCNTSCWSYQC